MSTARFAFALVIAASPLGTLRSASAAEAIDVRPQLPPPATSARPASAVSPLTEAELPPPAPPSTASAPIAAPPSPPPIAAPRTTSATSSLRVNVQADAQVAEPGAKDAVAHERPATNIDDATLLHGIRFGYGVVMNYDQPTEAFGGQSLKEKVGLRSPHHFLLGYELVYRVTGHSWLNVLLLGNGMVAGLEQSKVLPSANLMVGFEIKNAFQVGVGANLSPLKGSEAHTVVAAGWTPRIGTIYTPVHAYFIPDVDGVHRLGLTTGVTF